MAVWLPWPRLTPGLDDVFHFCNTTAYLVNSLQSVYAIMRCWTPMCSGARPEWQQSQLQSAQSRDRGAAAACCIAAWACLACQCAWPSPALSCSPQFGRGRGRPPHHSNHTYLTGVRAIKQAFHRLAAVPPCTTRCPPGCWPSGQQRFHLWLAECGVRAPRLPQSPATPSSPQPRLSEAVMID